MVDNSRMFVNNKKYYVKAPLKDGDKISICGQQMKYLVQGKNALILFLKFIDFNHIYSIKQKLFLAVSYKQTYISSGYCRYWCIYKT